ncbi:MAG: CDP-diacylglycerol--glycerol-3-phosphate 3-phosphatidyltransferase [Betaproteobacteria bacterium]|nr:CDP-diacylglycerol--glycerol-3-phosphate 3-phosphatidyltransferase [Betaproteobacteria bacterium]
MSAKLFNWPNLVTWLRILMIPVFIGVYYVPYEMISYEWKNIIATGIFVFAAVTDWLDGYLARTLNQMSAFGAFLDPVADKLIVVGALIVLLQLGRVEAVVGLIIIGREIAISALREWMAKIGQAKSMTVAFVGKVKTTSQMIAIPLLLFHDDLFGIVNCQWLGTILINVAAVLTVVSMLYYLRKAYPHVNAG